MESLYIKIKKVFIFTEHVFDCQENLELYVLKPIHTFPTRHSSLIQIAFFSLKNIIHSIHNFTKKL